MNLKKLESYLPVNLLGPGPRLIKKKIYLALVSQRLRNTAVSFWGRSKVWHVTAVFRRFVWSKHLQKVSVLFKRSDGLKALLKKIQYFWDMMQWRLRITQSCFAKASYHHLQGRLKIGSSTLLWNLSIHLRKKHDVLSQKTLILKFAMALLSCAVRVWGWKS